MIYYPVEKLIAGMELARNIPGQVPTLPFVVAGCKLTERMIRHMERVGIQGAYITTEFSMDVEPEDFVEPELKAKMLINIRSAFHESLKKMTFQSSRQIYKNMSEVAESIVMNLLSKDQYLFQMIDIRDYNNYTYSHSLYVGILSVILGRHIGLPVQTLENLAICGLFHDIGKIQIPLEILDKPGALTDEEFEFMKQHPRLGYDNLCKNTMISQMTLQGVLTHHERFNGSGYPQGLCREGIPLFGRIIAIADVYDALTSTRTYRKAWSPKKIFDYMTSCTDTHFDPELLAAFLKCTSAYPVGTMVQLSDGSTAVVKGNTPGFPLRPSIRFLTPPSKAGLEVDLSFEALNLIIVDTD